MLNRSHHSSTIPAHDSKTMAEEIKQTDETTPSPTTKKQKTMVEQSPDSEWPAAWLMPDGDCENQKAKNMREPNVPVTVAELKDIGIW